MSSHAYFDFQPTFHWKMLIFDLLDTEEQDINFETKNIQIYKNKTGKKIHKKFRKQ